MTGNKSYLLVSDSTGNSVEEEKILSFSFKKDVYTPYTMLTMRAEADTASFLSASEIKFYVNGKLVHHGLIDRLIAETSGGSKILTLISRGFTSLLCQNQIEPGLKTGVSINNLMDSFYELPHVTHEDNAEQSSYIYLKSNTSMWDAIVSLSYKHCGTYPYIRGTNCVRITPAADPTAFAYENEELISIGEVLNARRLTSHFHMSDINGEFGEYELIDSDVTGLGIVRHKYFELDRRFLNEPYDAVTFRNKYDTRAFKQRFCIYSGYNGEDLSDVISFTGVNSERIAAVEITGSNGGVKTRIGVYYDKFPRSNISE